jgi:hypothetical protein
MAKKKKAKKKKVKPKLKCPHCGNEDLDTLFYGEWIPSQRKILSVDEKGTLFVDSYGDDKPEAAKDSHLWCDGCTEESELPDEFNLAFDDELVDE